MNRFRIPFAIYGAVLASYLCLSHVQGEGSANTQKVSKVKPTMRNNPQAYRSHYFFGK